MVNDQESKKAVQEKIATTSADQANSEKNTDSKHCLTECQNEEVSDQSSTKYVLFQVL